MVNICLFDTLEFKKDGQQVLEELINTRKTKQFLSYIILNKDRLVTQKELFELLWSGQEFSNPGTALRTLLYRYRTLIAEKQIEELEDSVFSKRNAYQWNSELDVSIDIFDFETYSVLGLNDANSIENREECLRAAINLYRGPLLSDYAGDHWVVKKAVQYRDMYVNDVHQYVEIVKKRKDYEEIVRVVTKALELVGENDVLKAELRRALNKYDDLSKFDDYDEIVLQAEKMETEVSELQRSMEAEDFIASALVCNMETFKEVYRMQRRLLARTGETMYLSILTLGYSGGIKPDALKHEKLMSLFVDTLKRSLRCGDSLCRYSENSIAVMYPTGSYDDARKIIERVRRVYLAKLTGEKLVVTYRVRPLSNVNE